MANEIAERQATRQVDLPSPKLTLLLGTFGRDEAARALVRLRDGKIRTVTPGDALPEGRVVAIEPGRLGVDRNGQTRWILQPG